MNFEIGDEPIRLNAEAFSESHTADLRAALLVLVSEGKIKHTKKSIEKASEDVLEMIFNEYSRKQLDEANDQLSVVLIRKFSELFGSMKLVRDAPKMEEDLLNNELLRRDLKNVVSYVTPYIPFIGILSGGVTVGKHVVESAVCKDDEDS